MEVEKEIFDESGTRRVKLFRRDDGAYGFEEWRWSEEPLEQCWTPVSRDSSCVCPDLATVEREARGRVPWLNAVDPPGLTRPSAR